MDYNQIIPNKPEFLTDSEWMEVLRRDKRQCWRIDQCVNGSCSINLDCDHRQPQSFGGDDSFTNIRLACEDWNRRNGAYRGRKDEPDEYWIKSNWWDGPFASDKLRMIQYIAGYEAVLNDIASVPNNFRNELLKTVTLLAGFTGIGKTILMVSVLFAVNKVVGVGRPRHKHVLVFEPHQALRDLVADEWRDDPFNLGLVQAHPQVHVRDSFASLAKGPMGADVVVCCPNSLWEVKRKEEARTEEQVREVLSLYDTIIWDECDAANDRIIRLCEIASHALKYWMTASPPMGNEKFLKNCVLINNSAIADYSRALSLDKCLKLLADKIIPAAQYGSAEFLDGGVRVDDNNAIVGRDHAAFLAAIKSAVVSADNLEREMKRCEPEHWYSPHVVVRLERKSEIDDILRDIPNELNRLRDSGLIHGEGWNVSAVYDGYPGRKLSDRGPSGSLHPFMSAKNNFGKATKDSSRILLMADIGTRGINNWPLLYVVDLTSISTMPEILQFVFGRPVRLPGHLSPWVLDSEKSRFIRTVIYSLRDLLVTEDGSATKKTKGFEATANFVHNQLDVMTASGFLTWDDLASGRKPSSINVTFDPGAVPFSASDKIGLLVGIGKSLEEGPVDIKTIERITESLIPPGSGRRRERAINFGMDILSNREFRIRELPLEFQRNTDAERVVARLKPQEQYSIDELRRFVESDEGYVIGRQQYLAALSRDDFIAVNSVSKDLRTQQHILYREAPTTLRLNQDVLRPLGGELYDRLIKYGELGRENRDAVFRSVTWATKELFRVDSAKDGGPLDSNPYHIAILGRHRDTIIRAALGSLIKSGMCPNLGRVANL